MMSAELKWHTAIGLDDGDCQQKVQYEHNNRIQKCNHSVPTV